MNDIESPANDSQTVSRLERGRRAKQKRSKKQKYFSITVLSAFSMTILLGSLMTETTFSIFTDSVSNQGAFKAAEDFCAERDDTHQNGEDHPDPPGNGYGHCKDHNNNGDGNDDKGPGQGGAPYGSATDDGKSEPEQNVVVPETETSEAQSTTKPETKPDTQNSPDALHTDSVPPTPLPQQDSSTETPPVKQP